MSGAEARVEDFSIGSGLVARGIAHSGVLWGSRTAVRTLEEVDTETAGIGAELVWLCQRLCIVISIGTGRSGRPATAGLCGL